jgi:hypothetical protein
MKISVRKISRGRASSEASNNTSPTLMRTQGNGRDLLRVDLIGLVQDNPDLIIMTTKRTNHPLKLVAYVQLVGVKEQ